MIIVNCPRPSTPRRLSIVVYGPLMRSYPDFNDDPGLEDWLPPEKWKADRVFTDLQKWVYPAAASDSTDPKRT